LVEGIAQLLNSRGNYLKNKLTNFFGEGILKQLYENKLIKAYSNKREPAFIDKSVFSQSLLEILFANNQDSNKLTANQTTMGVLPESVKNSLDFIIQKSKNQIGNQLQYIQEEIEKLYEAYMEKLGIWYKAWLRIVLGITGFIFACLFNIDTINMYHLFSTNDTLRANQVQFSQILLERKDDIELNKTKIQTLLAEEGITSIKNESFFDQILNAVVLKDNEEALIRSQSLGIGFGKFKLTSLIGCLLTGVALSFGSTFWFSFLKKLLLK